MRKMLLVFMMAGILMMGTFSIIVEVHECNFQVQDLSDDGDSILDEDIGGGPDPSPCGGGGSGEGPAPG
jgi:hypothetical protein